MNELISLRKDRIVYIKLGNSIFEYYIEKEG